jgi:putative ubiquitin-RnfH superfamily antitoxin RatB of RatAB toxin-antitoxin module
MMREVTIRLSEPEAQALEEMAMEVGITLEEAVVRSIRYVLKEAMPFHQNYLQFRSKMFWEHYRYLQEVLSGGGQ